MRDPAVPTDHEIALFMEAHATGFARNLALTWLSADAKHRALITATFPSTWNGYMLGLMQQTEERQT